jgi:hypothetical protein
MFFTLSIFLEFRLFADLEEVSEKTIALRTPCIVKIKIIKFVNSESLKNQSRLKKNFL